MEPLGFISFYKGILQSKHMSEIELAHKIHTPVSKVYDLFKNGKKGHCPHADIVKAIEHVLGIESLDASFYGWGSPYKGGHK